MSSAAMGFVFFENKAKMSSSKEVRRNAMKVELSIDALIFAAALCCYADVALIAAHYFPRCHSCVKKLQFGRHRSRIPG